MISRILLSLFLLSVFDQALISMESAPKVEIDQVTAKLIEKIDETSFDSPFEGYDKGLELIQKVLALPSLGAFSLKTLARLATNNDPTYNTLVKKVYAKVPLDQRKELSLEVFKVRNPRGVLKFSIDKLKADFLARTQTTPIYSSKHLLRRPLVLWNEPLIDANGVGKAFQQGKAFSSQRRRRYHWIRALYP